VRIPKVKRKANFMPVNL